MCLSQISLLSMGTCNQLYEPNSRPILPQLHGCHQTLWLRGLILHKTYFLHVKLHTVTVTQWHRFYTLEQFFIFRLHTYWIFGVIPSSRTILTPPMWAVAHVSVIFWCSTSWRKKILKSISFSKILPVMPTAFKNIAAIKYLKKYSFSSHIK